jgi:hypothetical protein
MILKQQQFMPAKTERQRRFMALCSHNPSAAKGKCPSKKVSREFSHAPKEWPKKHRYH